MLFADVDALKEINDAFGHSMGDEALIQVAEAFRATFRESDILARVGGDEFVALAVDVDSRHTKTLTSRLQKNIESSNAQNDKPFEVLLSLGAVAYEPEKPCSLDTLLTTADERMYDTKRAKQGMGCGEEEQKDDARS